MDSNYFCEWIYLKSITIRILLAKDPTKLCISDIFLFYLFIFIYKINKKKHNFIIMEKAHKRKGGWEILQNRKSRNMQSPQSRAAHQFKIKHCRSPQWCMESDSVPTKMTGQSELEPLTIHYQIPPFQTQGFVQMVPKTLHPTKMRHLKV